MSLKNSDDNELTKLLEKESNFQMIAKNMMPPALDSPKVVEKTDEDIKRETIQWSSLGSGKYAPCGVTKSFLPPGYYSIKTNPTIGIFFSSIPVKTEGLIRFPNLASDTVIEEIRKFWELEKLFLENELTYKRGIMLWGPPGSGKSSTIQFLLKDIIERGGIAIQFQNPYWFQEAITIIRIIQPETPIIVLMEDIDEIIRTYDESSVLNILDGIFGLYKIAFIATTNFPERLGARIINRPSRFDKRFKIGHPDSESRKIYIMHLFRHGKIEVDVEKWVRDTEGFSFAHIRELFVAVTILGDKYSDAVATLSSMREQPMASIEESFVKRKTGF